jgi:hypothetical protein
MELNFKGSFLRDLEKIQNKYLLKALSDKIREIKSAKNSTQISQLKKFKAYKSIWYKIEIHQEHGNKIYWLLCIIRKNKVEFRRIKTESFFKKNY